RLGRLASSGAGAKTPPSSKGSITFVANTHDYGRVDRSADTVLRLIDVFGRYQVRGDFYLTAQAVEAYARSRPEVIRRLVDSQMTISYHLRPPHPGYPGFEYLLQERQGQALEAALRDYE